MDRRSVLAGMAALLVVPAAGCTGSPAGRSPGADGTDAEVLREARAATAGLADRARAALAGQPDRGPWLRPALATHRAHLAALDGGSTPTGGPPRRFPVPADGEVVLRRLAGAERAAARAHWDLLGRGSPGVARLLASVAAAESVLAAALGGRLDRPLPLAPTAAPARVSTPSPAPDTSEPTAALQAALAAEHAAVYGYGVVGARADAGLEPLARSALDAHRAARDWLAAELAARGRRPDPPAAGYLVPAPPGAAAGPAGLAVRLERRVGTAYADLVAAGSRPVRGPAAAALARTAVRAAQWGSVATVRRRRGPVEAAAAAAGLPFPGLPER